MLTYFRRLTGQASRYRGRVDEPKKSTRGFASMDPEKRREVASLGGKSVPREKRSFALDSTLASRAGGKSGAAIDPKSRPFSKDPKLASEAGRKGGYAARNAP